MVDSRKNIGLVSKLSNSLPRINHTLVIGFCRFKAGLIYTYIGEVCVSVNPYRTLNIYGQDYVNKYKGKLENIVFALWTAPQMRKNFANSFHSYLSQTRAIIFEKIHPASFFSYLRDTSRARSVVVLRYLCIRYNGG